MNHAMMARIGLTLARLTAAIWIGAAFLFVLTSVTEQMQATFETDVKNRLALIRFPWFYGTGFVLLTLCGLATAGTALAARTRSVVLSLIVATLTLMALDYLLIYRPLRDLLAASDTVRPPEFARLHRWSEVVNSFGFLLAATAATVLCAAEPRSKGSNG